MTDEKIKAEREELVRRLTEPEYLGDGLYVSFDGYQYRLYASDGEHTTNEVFLDQGVVRAFDRFREHRVEIIKEMSELEKKMSTWPKTE